MKKIVKKNQKKASQKSQIMTQRVNPKLKYVLSSVLKIDNTKYLRNFDLT